jgi:amino acid transporter
MSKVQAALKRVVLGRPMSSGELEHTLLPKIIALPVFSSDPLSSNAYATQEAMIVLALAGAAGLSYILPISFAVATLLTIVVISYRETVKAYPTGGGAYRVSRENLGMYPGLISASALLTDYVLTVAVSMTAGVDAIVSAAEGLAPFRIELAIVFVVLVTLANLRGAKESGTLFAVPTYGFVLSIYIMLATGFVKCLGGCPQAESAGLDLGAGEAITLVLILRAFAAGTTALTGVEAIADGVGAFRYPQSRNAATTLAIMATLSISMFLGISWLADHTNVVYIHDAEGVAHQRTVVAQIAAAVFNENFMFYVVQAMSAAILLLAANTAYQDFPRISSILAQDHFMPHQFQNRGDRLVFSNGIIILAVLSSILIYAFDADLNRLIQLYLVGVFISFTFSQWGMVRRSVRLRPSGWRKTVVISGFGGTVTGVVLLVIAYSKFTHGAWMVLAAIPVLVYVMRSIYAHYSDVRAQLGKPERRPTDRRPGNQHFVIFVPRIDQATSRAIGYTRAISPSSVEAVTASPIESIEWNRLAPDIELTRLNGNGSVVRQLRQHLADRRVTLARDDFLTVIVPEVLKSRSVFEIFRRPGLHRLKAGLLRARDVQVLDIPVVEEDIDPEVEATHEPTRNYAIVLVSGVHNATLQAIEYAETLRATDIRAVSFGLDPERTESLGNDWLEAQIPVPLEIEAAPFRDMGNALVNYLRPFASDGTHRTITIIVPEFVVPTRRHQLLHGQAALIVKRHLLFERGIVVVSVPYHLD